MLISKTRHRAKGLLLWFGLGLMVLLPASLAFGQTAGSSTLRGIVKDPTGAVVSKATVMATNDSTGFTRKAETTDDGVYVFSAMDPGVYTVKVEVEGFKTAIEKGIQINPSETRGLDFGLQVGQKGEEITITGTAEAINKETGAKENTITAKQIDNLSIISRSSLELLRILPGVVAPSPTDPNANLQSVTFGGGGNANTLYNVNGLRGEENFVTVDGSHVMDIGANNGSMITTNPDMVSEVKVQTSNYSAEFGTSGVSIVATTKNGSASFHGEVYDYIRNYRFNADDRSNSLFGVPKTNDTYQYPGGNIGGPILLPFTHFNKNRDKLFFFFGAEIQRQSVATATTFNTVPTAAERAGVIAGKPPFTPTAIGSAFLNMYPLPNFSGTPPIQGENYALTALQPTNRDQEILRVDYNITQNTKMYVRLSREKEGNDSAKGVWWGPSAYELPSHELGKNHSRTISINLVQIINPTLTNEIVASGGKLWLDNNYADPSKLTLAALGIQNVYKSPFGNVSPVAPVAFITSWGYGPQRGDLWNPGGNNPGTGIFAHNSSFSITDNLTKVKGAHTLKFGTFIEQADKRQDFNLDPEGRFIYAPWGNHSTGNPWSDILTGKITQSVFSTTNEPGSFREYNYEFYAQDSWKVKPNFTLEFGLRALYYPNNYEQNGLGTLFDPGSYVHGQGVLLNNDPNKPNGILTAKFGQIPNGVVGNPPVEWAPRLNFAWDISGKGDTVIRGGAGIFYNRVQGNYQYYSISSPPNSYDITFDGYAFGSLGGGQGLNYTTMGQPNPFTAQGAIGINSDDPNSVRTPRIANLSFSIARRLPFNTVVEAAYVGTEGRHLPYHINIDFIPPGTLLSGKVGNANLNDPTQRWAVANNSGFYTQFRPFPAYSSIAFNDYNGTSSYHALQVTASHQQGKNLQFFATYTFSKALGTTQTNENDGNGTDPIDVRHRQWGVLPYDRTQVFNLSYNYNLPNLARGMFSNPVTRGMLNGWQMSGITTFQSGQPLFIHYGGVLGGAASAVFWTGSDAFSGNGNTSGPVGVVFNGDPRAGVNYGGTTVGSKILNVNSIGVPSLQSGNSGPFVAPFYIRGPHLWNWDMSFFKNFRISESKKIQFRAGLFDIFNQAYPVPSDGDVNTFLQTDCNVTTPDPVNNGSGTVGGPGNPQQCVPAGGFHINGDPKHPFSATQRANPNETNSWDTFGLISSKHGHRIVEFAIKFYF